MKKLMFVAAAAVSMFLVGCGGGDICSSKSKCSAQMQASQAQIDACKAATASGAKCVTEYNALANCSLAKEVCAADNTTDAAATLAACQTEYNAYSTCLTK